MPNASSIVMFFTALYFTYPTTMASEFGIFFLKHEIAFLKITSQICSTSYYRYISLLSYKVSHSGFRETTVLCLKYIGSCPWFDSNGWCETQKRVESSLRIHVQFSTEKAGQVTAFYVLESNWCFWYPNIFHLSWFTLYWMHEHGMVN